MEDFSAAILLTIRTKKPLILVLHYFAHKVIEKVVFRDYNTEL